MAAFMAAHPAPTLFRQDVALSALLSPLVAAGCTVVAMAEPLYASVLLDGVLGAAAHPHAPS
jgi:hypothetical protein